MIKNTLNQDMNVQNEVLVKLCRIFKTIPHMGI